MLQEIVSETNQHTDFIAIPDDARENETTLEP
jgi:hypothetical protein